MKFKPTYMITALAVICLLISVNALAGGIKDRMKQRLSAIVQLKAQGIIGENNRGYLGFVGSKKSQESLIESENKDRKLIYSKIAQQQNTTLELVEKRRALKLAKRAKPGEYIQKEDGTWQKK